MKKIFFAGLIGFGLVCGFVVLFCVYWYLDLEKSEVRRRQMQEEQRSGKWDFGDQPALLAVAQAIAKNDQDAIRAAAKAVPDLQAPGRDGRTLLCFAVEGSWQRPELLEAVRTLLSLGVDPNYTNGRGNSFALASAVHGSALLLRSMLEAGGDANARDEHGRPMILMNWYLGYYKHDQRARLDLLLDRGADINSTMPDTESDVAGYTLLLYRTKMGRRNPLAYADALHLLERGADPHRIAGDGMTLAKMLMEHREYFTSGQGTAPPEFAPLWEWVQTHGLLPQRE